MKDEERAPGKDKVEDPGDYALADTDDLELGGDVIPAAEDAEPDEENVANTGEHTRGDLQDQSHFNNSSFAISR